MKRLLSLILVAVLLLPVIALANTASLDATILYGIGGGSTGGTFNAMGNIFAQFFNEGKVFGQFSATATTGGVQNVMFMKNGTCDMAIVGQSVFVQATDGTDSFAESGAYEDLTIIAPLYSAIFQQFVGAGIKSEADLRGKKLVVGGPGSGDLALAKTIYGAMGMEFDKDFTPMYLGSYEGAEAMKDGHADGAIAVTQLPFSTFVELTNADKAFLIPLGQSTIDAMSDPGTHTFASCYPAVIPANTYKNQTEELPTFATATLLCARGNLSEDLVYALTKYMWENIAELNTLHAAVANLSIESVKQVENMPLHPGALKYYKEVGII